MTRWQIKPLYYGEIVCPKSVVTPGRDDSLELAAPYLGFLLINGDRYILVDTGIDDDYIADGKAWGSFPARGDHFSPHCMRWGKMDEIVSVDGKRKKINPAPDVWGRFIPSTLIYSFYDSSYQIIAHMEADEPAYLFPGHEPSLLCKEG